MAPGPRRWRWSNVPVPRIHVAALLVGVVLHWLAPWRTPLDRPDATAVGVGLVGLGVAVVGWAVWTVGRVDVERPETLVTTGPYAHSRNPMYVGWTCLYAGVALLVTSAWLLALLPLVLVVTHVQIRREERSLERTFEDEYRSYRRTVRRYV